MFRAAKIKKVNLKQLGPVHTCEKESEVRSEKDGEEEETYLASRWNVDVVDEGCNHDAQ